MGVIIKIMSEREERQSIHTCDGTAALVAAACSAASMPLWLFSAMPWLAHAKPLVTVLAALVAVAGIAEARLVAAGGIEEAR